MRSGVRILPSSTRETGVRNTAGSQLPLGKRRSKFEAGIGANLGIYTQKGSYWKYIYNADAGAIQRVERATVSRTHFGYYLFTNIGYRYQRVSGFLFRVGISPSFHFGGRHGIRKTPFIYPYVSFGYTFK